MLVTPETAMGIGAIRACVTLLARIHRPAAVRELYQRDEKGGRRRATGRIPCTMLIHSQPNRKDTSFEYYEQQQGVLGLEGNSYSLIDRHGNGDIAELIPINPKKVIVLKGPDGMPYYELPELGETVPMRMMHHTSSSRSTDTWAPHRFRQTRTFSGWAWRLSSTRRVFAVGTTMSGVIERPKEAGAIKSQASIDKLLAKWTDRYSGVRNAFSVALLQEGMSYKQLSQDNGKKRSCCSRGSGR